MPLIISPVTLAASTLSGTVAIANGGTGATTASAARTNLGAGTVTSVGGTGTVSGLTLTGTVTGSGNLTLGGTLSVAASNFASQTANTVLAAPSGAAGVPTFRALVAADIPTLNQNTTGSAGTLTTARNINGTSFNGSADITTANWGTSRNITIGKTSRSVNGSAAVTWDIGDIGLPDGADSVRQWTVAANGAQARRHTIARVYGTPNHWIGTWQNIRIKILQEDWSSGYVDYNLFGYYGMGNGNSWILRLKDADGANTSYFRVSLGTVTYAGWQYSGQNTYYQDIYIDIDYYTTVRVIATTYGHSYQTTNPTDGTSGCYTVFYDSPSAADIAYVNDDKSSTYHFGDKILNAANYNSYAPTLTGGGASGTWGISITGNAATASNSSQLGGYSPSNYIGYNGNNYYQVNNWIQLNGAYGLYAPNNNGAHFYPNNATYGSWRIAGTRNGWYGLEFDSGVSLMANSSEVGFHRNGYGWQFWWSGGTGYVHKGNPGGGTQATILDSANYTNYTGIYVLKSGDTMTGSLTINGTLTATSKSFLIPHPTKPGKKLRYGSLEGPENGVYVRGRLQGTGCIQLPEYWTKLVDPDSITVQLTCRGKPQQLYVTDIRDNCVWVDIDGAWTTDIDCYYFVQAERKDVAKLQVEE